MTAPVVAVCLCVVTSLTQAGCDALFSTRFIVPEDAGGDDGSVDAMQGARLPECERAPTLPALPTTGTRTLYVDNSRTGSQCLETDPCPTITLALANVIGSSVGAVINVKGTVMEYNEAITLTASHHGVVLRAWEGFARPRIAGNGTPDAVVGILNADTDIPLDIVVAGFDISGGNLAGIQIQGIYASDVTIVNNHIHDNGLNDMADPQAGAILLTDGASNALIAQNRVFANRDDNMQVPGIRVAPTAGGNHTIFDNDIFENNGPGLLIRSESNLILKNRVFKNEDTGIEIEDASNVLCHNITWMNMHGVQINEGAANCSLVHHTSVANAMDGVQIRAAELTMKNVIMAFNTGCGGRGVDFDPKDRHNLYFENGGGARCTYSTDQEELDLEVDPQFENAAEGDLDLLPTSPALTAGENGTTMGAL